MKFIADLHIHSPFSRATSKTSHLRGLAAWASIKGINVVGTGDFTHPAWFAQITEQLVEAEPGFFKLGPQYTGVPEDVPELLKPYCRPEEIRFVLTAEISSIYKKHGKVRKNHNILFASTWDEVRSVNRSLADIGNIRSDGRPILGLDARDLLEIVLEKAPEGFLVPAHIWTPWFSLFGSKSGFDSIDECFEDLTPHVFALETGLSSDPEMNRCVSALDRFTLISNSDCHSPAKLGREANIFATEFDYFHMRDAIRNPVNKEGEQVFHGTIEFYPEEGKYHCDGHRKCGVCMEPHETAEHKGVCPVCNKPLTIGVWYRVAELSDRDQPIYPAGSPGVVSCTSLQEILSELLGVGPATKKVAAAYSRLIQLFGSEFNVLLEVPHEEIGAKTTPVLGEAIRRIRNNEVIRKPGYDGEFGVIRVYDEGEKEELAGQMSMFALPKTSKKKKKAKPTSRSSPRIKENAKKDTKGSGQLNPEQRGAVESDAPVIVVKAGPGTGKTHALVSRVARLAGENSDHCTVISFTNKAADEVRERLASLLGNASHCKVFTFHGYCLYWLRRENPLLKVAGPESRRVLLEGLCPGRTGERIAEIDLELSRFFREPSEDIMLSAAGRAYIDILEKRNLVDIESVISSATALLKRGDEPAEKMRRETGRLFVDEFQDVNAAQFELVSELTRSSEVFVIGDPDQAIYAFRGADSRWFSQYAGDHDAELHQLKKNYRNGKKIIQAGEGLIAHNEERIAMAPLEPMSDDSGFLFIKQCSDPTSEACFIADHIERLVGGTSHREIEKLDAGNTSETSLKDIGILFRTARQAARVARLLETRGVPFQLVDHRAFYTAGEVRKLYAATLFTAGIADPDSQLYLLGLEKGIGKSMLGRVQEQLLEQEASGASILDLSWLGDSKQEQNPASFRHFYSQLIADSPKKSVQDILDAIVLYYRLDKADDEIKRFFELAGSCANTLSELGDYLQRYSDGVLYDPKAECVTLSTLHAAKGLEFPVVFIAGVERDLLPYRRAEDEVYQPEQLQEERRLFYVGITRAAHRLYLTWCAVRQGFDNTLEKREPSCFLRELPRELIAKSDPLITKVVKKRRKHRQLKLFR